ncbi:MAG TPA: hypothetical protein VFV99_08795 [Kofleriaceae bacterium]|nr:hypothetical protein [Kofleriaceae bacterium]
MVAAAEIAAAETAAAEIAAAEVMAAAIAVAAEIVAADIMTTDVVMAFVTTDVMRALVTIAAGVEHAEIADRRDHIIVLLAIDAVVANRRPAAGSAIALSLRRGPYQHPEYTEQQPCEQDRHIDLLRETTSSPIYRSAMLAV